MIFKKLYAYARGLQGSGTTATEMFPKLKDQSMQQSNWFKDLYFILFFYFLRHKKRYKDLESLSSCYQSLKFAANKMQLNLPTIVKESWYLLARWLPIQQQVCTKTTSLHSTWGRGSVNGVGVVLCKSPLHRIVQEKIVMFKHTFFKTIRGGMLSWMELCAVVLEIEIQLNWHPLPDVKDDTRLLLLTPASFLF